MMCEMMCWPGSESQERMWQVWQAIGGECILMSCL